MTATLTNIDRAKAGPTPGYHHVPEPRIKAALQRHAGNISCAAQALGMSRQALHARVQRSPALQEAVQGARDCVADIAESRIVRAIQRGDMATVRWFADRQMRDRGYGRDDHREKEVPPPDPAKEARAEELKWEMIRLLDKMAAAKAAGKDHVLIDVTPKKASAALPGR